MRRIAIHPLPLFVLITLLLSGCDFISLPSLSLPTSSPSVEVSSAVLESTSELSSTSEDVSSFTSSTEDTSGESTPSTSAHSETSSASETPSSSSSDTSTTSTTTSSNTSTSSQSSLPSSAYQYSGYYSSLQGLADTQLMSALRPLLRQALGNDGLFPSSVTYQTAITALQNADRDPNNSNNVIIWYRMTSVSKTWDSGTTWNREHVWPQSLMGVDTSNGSRHKGSDAHNLKPANPSDNSSRGNKYFSETTSSASYVPPASIRGDIARILFYMVTMYPELSLVDVTSGSPATYTMAQFSLMVKWHLQDPVDDFESRRNQILYEHQDNRNPFIDHEELVCRMFRNQTSQALQYCQA